MRCPTCEEENDDQERQCKKCGSRLPRPSRRREIQSVPNSWVGNRLDDRAFRLAIWGLIPPAGIVLGPLSVTLGVLSIRRARAAGETGYTPAMMASLAIGGMSMLCSWLGLSLMLLGILS
jgi:hypothetical protein